MVLNAGNSNIERDNSEGWSDEQLRSTIDAYMGIRAAELAGQPVNKAKIYRELSQQFGRSPGAFERRMQNISAVLDAWNLPWIGGLKPLRNVGAHVRPRIESLLREQLDTPSSDMAAYEPQVVTALQQPAREPPAGIKKPTQVIQRVSQYVRSLEVKAWVLQQARGRCECCDKGAPFKTVEGIPYLEVHHLKTLASGGSDTVSNTIAICPNCHRRLHYSHDAPQLRQSLLKKIGRLRAE